MPAENSETASSSWLLAGPVTLQGRDQACPRSAIGTGSSLTVYTSLGLNQIEAIIGKYVQ
jgi:hypothetical protein